MSRSLSAMFASMLILIVTAFQVPITANQIEPCHTTHQNFYLLTNVRPVSSTAIVADIHLGLDIVYSNRMIKVPVVANGGTIDSLDKFVKTHSLAILQDVPASRRLVFDAEGFLLSDVVYHDSGGTGKWESLGNYLRKTNPTK